MSENKDDPAFSEWVVGIKWEKTFERDQTKRLRDKDARHIPATIDADKVRSNFLSAKAYPTISFPLTRSQPGTTDVGRCSVSDGIHCGTAKRMSRRP